VHAHAYSRITKGPSTITLIMSKAFPVSRDTSVRLGILCVMWVHDPGKKAFWGLRGPLGATSFLCSRLLLCILMGRFSQEKAIQDRAEFTEHVSTACVYGYD
jgi:hypothetical protein